MRAESFQVGSVSLSMRYFPDGRLTEDAFRAAQIAAGAELEEALVPFARRHWQEALGSSGTVGAVSQLLAASGITDGSDHARRPALVHRRCLRAGHIDRLALPGLKDERRLVIAGGLSILYTLATHFGIEALRPARGALRQGVIFDLDERHIAKRDPRRRTTCATRRCANCSAASWSTSNRPGASSAWPTPCTPVRQAGAGRRGPARERGASCSGPRRCTRWA